MSVVLSHKDFYHLVLKTLEEQNPGKKVLQVLQTGFSTLSFELILPTYLELRGRVKSSATPEGINIFEEFEPELAQMLTSLGGLALSVDQNLQKARLSILKKQFPEAGPQSDDEIARYFRTRRMKALEQSRRIYGHLSLKYPDLEARATLLRWHRTRSPLYFYLYTELKNQLADRLLNQAQHMIQYLLRCFIGTTKGNAWELMKPISQAVKILPADKLKAARILEELQEYARILNFHLIEFNSICEVLASYYGDHLFAHKQITLVLPKSFQDEHEKKQKATVLTYNVAKTEFSAQDLKEILINPKIQGLENITLTYCWMYWLKTQDPVFENKVSLYSLRNKTFHKAVFTIIKNGQAANSKDEDILYAVYNLVTRDSPYEYNVRKDIYMQSVWKRIKPGVEKPEIENVRLHAEELIAQERKERTARRLHASQEVDRNRKERDLARQQAAESVEKQKLRDIKARENAEKRVTAMQEEAKLSRERAEERAGFTKAKTSVPEKIKPQPSVWTKYDGAELNSDSIKSRVDGLTNKSGKNLHVLFRSHMEAQIRDFIDSFIKTNALNVKTVQITLATLAVKDFLLRNYEASNRSWVMSNERLKVKELGMDIEDIEPIIDKCVAQLEKGNLN